MRTTVSNIAEIQIQKLLCGNGTIVNIWCLLSFILDVFTCGRTSRGRTGETSHRRKVTQEEGHRGGRSHRRKATEEEGHTGERLHRIHPPAVLALIFLAKRIQPSLSLVDREVEF